MEARPPWTGGVASAAVQRRSANTGGVGVDMEAARRRRLEWRAGRRCGAKRMRASVCDNDGREVIGGGSRARATTWRRKHNTNLRRAEPAVRVASTLQHFLPVTSYASLATMQAPQLSRLRCSSAASAALRCHPPAVALAPRPRTAACRPRPCGSLHAAQEEQVTAEKEKELSVEQTTRKWGLEAGLWKARVARGAAFREPALSGWQEAALCSSAHFTAHYSCRSSPRPRTSPRKQARAATARR